MSLYILFAVVGSINMWAEIGLFDLRTLAVILLCKTCLAGLSTVTFISRVAKDGQL